MSVNGSGKDITGITSRVIKEFKLSVRKQVSWNSFVDGLDNRFKISEDCLIKVLKGSRKIRFAMRHDGNSEIMHAIMTPIGAAVYFENVDFLKKLVAMDVSNVSRGVNNKQKMVHDGSYVVTNPLGMACLLSLQRDIVDVLLSGGADVNKNVVISKEVEEEEGGSIVYLFPDDTVFPLILCLKCSCFSVVHALLDSGCDPLFKKTERDESLYCLKDLTNYILYEYTFSAKAILLMLKSSGLIPTSGYKVQTIVLLYKVWHCVKTAEDMENMLSQLLHLDVDLHGNPFVQYFYSKHKHLGILSCVDKIKRPNICTYVYDLEQCWRCDAHESEIIASDSYGELNRPNFNLCTEEFLRSFAVSVTNVKPLKALCRIAIRNIYGRRAVNKRLKASLAGIYPPLLIEYLTFADDNQSIA